MFKFSRFFPEKYWKIPYIALVKGPYCLLIVSPGSLKVRTGIILEKNQEKMYSFDLFRIQNRRSHFFAQVHAKYALAEATPDQVGDDF